jgi:hypothetical protein
MLMRRKWAIIVFVAIALTGLGVFAARLLPEPANTLERDGVVYSANEPLLGCVKARDKRTERVFWFRQVYVTVYDCTLEEDVQDVWITKLEIKGDSILVVNECGYEYLLNTKTLDVTPIKGPAVIHEHRLSRSKGR